MTADLDTLVHELEAAAASLRQGELDASAAAALVERCAELAGMIGAEVDSLAREAERGPGPAGEAQGGPGRSLAPQDQERLL